MQQLSSALEKGKEICTIVEGKKDKAALVAFGFTSLVCLEQRPLFEVIESITAKEVQVLTDLDPEGKKLYAALSPELQKRGVKINNNLRNLLFKTSLRQIEGLVHFEETHPELFQ